MRIGMMTDAYKPYVSGVTSYVDVNKRALEKLGHEVYVFTFGDLEYEDDEPRVIRSPACLSPTPAFISPFGTAQRLSASSKRWTLSTCIIHS